MTLKRRTRVLRQMGSLLSPWLFALSSAAQTLAPRLPSDTPATFEPATGSFDYTSPLCASL